jgi:Spy/CpxP family protein refolding chaperone
MRLHDIVRASLVVLASVLAVGAAQARGPFGDHHAGPGVHGRFLEEHADRLDLDEEVRIAIRAIVKESRAKAEELHERLQQERVALHDMLEADTVDEAAVLEHAEVLGRIESEMVKHRLQSMLRVRSLLTPAQRQELKEIRRERFEHWKSLPEACGPDLDALCPDADSPFARWSCLRENREQLSEECALAHRTKGGHEGCRYGPFGP